MALACFTAAVFVSVRGGWGSGIVLTVVGLGLAASARKGASPSPASKTGRDRMSLDGKAQLPGVRPGAGDASARLKLADAAMRTVTGEFNGERLAGRTWPVAENRVSVLELTY